MEEPVSTPRRKEGEKQGEQRKKRGLVVGERNKRVVVVARATLPGRGKEKDLGKKGKEEVGERKRQVPASTSPFLHHNTRHGPPRPAPVFARPSTHHHHHRPPPPQ